MNRSRPRARSPEEQERVRRRFVECAREVFAREGAHGLTMRKLAAAAGYSPGTIYLYFPSRQELLREVWKEDIVALCRRQEQAVTAAGDDPQARLKALLRTYSEFWFEQPDHFKAMFLEVERQYLRERAEFANDKSVKEIHELLLNETRRAMDSGGVRRDDVEVCAHSLLAAVHGVVALHIGSAGFPWADKSRMINLVIDNILAGLRSNGAAT